MKIGIYKKEIFIEDKNGYNVLRPVPKDVLEELRTIEGLINYGWDDVWKGAVQSDSTTLGLEDWLEECMDEVDMDDEEMFLGKDSSFYDELTEEEIATANQYMLDKYGIEVGTWECSGWFSSDGEFELILRNE